MKIKVILLSIFLSFPNIAFASGKTGLLYFSFLLPEVTTSLRHCRPCFFSTSFELRSNKRLYSTGSFLNRGGYARLPLENKDLKIFLITNDSPLALEGVLA